MNQTRLTFLDGHLATGAAHTPLSARHHDYSFLKSMLVETFEPSENIPLSAS